MKQFNPLTILLITFVLVFSHCKKDSETTATVEYLITPMNTYFTQITYKDASGNDVVINDYTQFASGVKSITVTPPFNARLEAAATSTSTSTANYTLVIKVNGEVKQTTPVSLPPMATTTNSVQYNIP